MTFGLQNNTYKPYRKTDNLPVCIPKHPNHPPKILNELPKSIAIRISDLSSSENIFFDAISVYKETPKQFDYIYYMYICKERQRNITKSIDE